MLLNSPRELVQRTADFADRDEDDGTSADDLAKSPKLYITDTQNDAVEFKITSDAADVTDSTFASFHAGQEVNTIVFTFGAVSTAIKGGQVRFTLPMGWTAYEGYPQRMGRSLRSVELKIEGDSGFQIKADRDKGIKKTPLSPFRMGAGRSPLESLN